MKKANKYINIRLVLVCAALSLAIISVVTKLVLLSISDGVFLQNEGKKRYIKYREIKSVRGGIYDRNNFPLAISIVCLLYTSPSPRDRTRSRMPSSA